MVFMTSTNITTLFICFGALNLSTTTQEITIFPTLVYSGVQTEYRQTESDGYIKTILDKRHKFASLNWI